MSFDARPAAFEVNGRPVEVEALPTGRLSHVLRESLGLTGTKVGCDAGDCGACTVLIDGEAHCACLTPAIRAVGRKITTVEGLAEDGRLSRLQAAFLRHGAAQCGICTPGMLMAAAALLARRPRPTEGEAEEALGGVLCRCTGYRKILAAVCDAWRDPAEAAAPAAARAVGARIERLDGLPKAVGSDVFGADRWPEGALWVHVIRSPHHHARFRFGDLAGWRAATPGVAAVFTAADIPGRNAFGVIPPFADQPALAEGVARFRGEAVALVALEPGAEADFDESGFPITWEALPEVLDPEAAKTAAPLHASRPGNLLIRGLVRRGDPEAALALAQHVASGEIETPWVEHAYIEPEAGHAEMEGETLVIRACTQAPHMDREDTAAVLGLAPDRVRIVPTSTGGGFGSKLDVSIQPLIGLVALRTGRPARIVYTRGCSMRSTTKRHPARMRARIGADDSGRIVGQVFDGDFNTGAYASWGPTVANRVPVHASGPYYVPDYRAEARAIHTHGPVSGAFRGFGVPQATIMQEVLHDELAASLGMDRLAFRRLNALRDGQATVCGQVLSAVGIADCLDALTAPWDEARDWAAAGGEGPIRRGIGVASCWYGCGNTALPNPSTIRIGIAPSGEVVLHQGATDIGQGSNTVIAQIAADALGVPVSAIRLVGPDTAVTPDAGKTSASRQTFVSGRAAAAAALSLRRAILRHANATCGAGIVFDGGLIRVSDDEVRRTIELGDLPTGADDYVFRAEESYDPPTSPLDRDGQGAPYAVYGYGAQIVELSVDTRLGTVRLHRITAAHDVGRVINPTLAEGQIEGGIAQGIGLALMEDYVPGRTENLHDYLIPTAGDVPEIRHILIEKPDPEGPFGAKGLGEHVLIPTAPAILNAIRHATGALVTRLPATPDRVLAAIRAAKEG